MNFKFLLFIAYLLVITNAEKAKDKKLTSPKEEKLTASESKNAEEHQKQASHQQSYHEGPPQSGQNDYEGGSQGDDSGRNYGEVKGHQGNTYHDGRSHGGHGQAGHNYGNGGEEKPDYDQGAQGEYQAQHQPSHGNFESAKIVHNYGVKGGGGGGDENSGRGAHGYQGAVPDTNGNGIDGAGYQEQGVPPQEYYSPNNAGGYKQQTLPQPVTTYYGGFKPIISQYQQPAAGTAYHDINNGGHHQQDGAAQYNHHQASPGHLQYQAHDHQQQNYQQQEYQQPQEHHQQEQHQPEHHQQTGANGYEQAGHSFEYQTNIGHGQNPGAQSYKVQDYPVAGHIVDYSSGEPYGGNLALKPYSTDYVSGVNVVKETSYPASLGKSSQQYQIVPSSVVQFPQTPKYTRAAVLASNDGQSGISHGDAGVGYVPSTGASLAGSSSGYDKASLDTYYDTTIKKILAQYQSSNYANIPSTSASYQASVHNSPIAASYPVTSSIPAYSSATASAIEYPSPALLGSPSLGLSAASSSSVGKAYNGYGFGNSYGYSQQSLLGYPAYNTGLYQSYLPTSDISLLYQGSKYPSAFTQSGLASAFGGGHRPYNPAYNYAAAASSKISKVIKSPFKTIRDALTRSKLNG